MSNNLMTPNMGPVAPGLVAAPHERRIGVAGRMTVFLAASALAFGPSAPANAQEGEPSPAPYDISAAGTKGGYDFSLAPACDESLTEPHPSTSLARKCVIWGLQGTDGKGADVVWIDASKTPIKKQRQAINLLEQLATTATDGVLRLDVHIVKPSKKATAALQEMKDSGCVDVGEAAGTAGSQMAVNAIADAMPQLNKYPHVIAVNDIRTCDDSIVGMSDMQSRVDIYKARLDEMTPKLLARTVLHEILHNLGLRHFGTLGNQAGAGANTIITSKYLAKNQLDLAKYLKKEATYGEYALYGENIMGSINELAKNQPLNRYQLSFLDRARRIIGDKKAHTIPALSANKQYTLKSNKAVAVKLPAAISMDKYNLDKERIVPEDEEDNYVYKTMVVESVTKGMRLILTDTTTSQQNVIGILPKVKGKDTVYKLILPGKSAADHGAVLTVCVPKKGSSTLVLRPL